MAVNPPPNQKFDAIKENRFTQVWFLWFEGLKEELNTISGGTP